MKKILLLLFTFSSITAFSQDASVSENSILSVNIIFPSLEYETPVSQKTTLDFRLGAGFAATGGTGRKTHFGIFPYLDTQYRYYYNLDNRLKKEKNINNNSANYLALHLGAQSGKAIIGELSSNANLLAEVGPVWGLQRYYGSGFKLDLNLGAGYRFNDLGGSAFTPLIGIKLGWLLSN